MKTLKTLLVAVLCVAQVSAVSDAEKKARLDRAIRRIEVNLGLIKKTSHKNTNVLTHVVTTLVHHKKKVAAGVIVAGALAYLAYNNPYVVVNGLNAVKNSLFGKVAHVVQPMTPANQMYGKMYAQNLFEPAKTKRMIQTVGQQLAQNLFFQPAHVVKNVVEPVATPVVNNVVTNVKNTLGSYASNVGSYVSHANIGSFMKNMPNVESVMKNMPNVSSYMTMRNAALAAGAVGTALVAGPALVTASPAILGGLALKAVLLYNGYGL